jgi:hypothetical protein
MKEYIIKYRVLTEWHNPYNTTTENSYTDVVSANAANEAVRKTLPSFSNPNITVELISVKGI